MMLTKIIIIFLVNLGHALQERRRTLSKSIKQRINNIMDENDIILKIFKQTALEKIKDDGEDSLYEIKSKTGSKV